ncbi:MAG TPA: tripartite tricarboxylate transporter substrate binding protein [Usitatibacter sp.]|jgi:tripartite-type tricarboxylate transporter receptor subunit TctC|nr:tripartite tricarboxylate transporter substrate binding protein [Usitatibacter sp.]
MQRRTLLKAAAVVVAALTAPWAAAQSGWPTRPVTLIVPFSAGGTTDIVARLVGARLSQVWGQPVVVEDRPGAGGNIGAGVVAKAPPDGYTLLVPSGSILTVNPHIYKDMGFDVQKDLVPITDIASGPMVVVVNPNVKARNLKELISLAKSEPGQINFGSAGVGSQVHMAGENFADAAGIDIRHIPYKGEAMGLNDLMGGQIQLMVGNIAAASNFVKSGRLRALAVTSRERSPMMPDVPTADEAGLAGFESVGWFGLMAPAGTPHAIVAKIQADTAKVLQTADVKTALAAQGMVPVGNKPEEMAQAVAEESRKWARVVANRHLQAH